MTAPCDGDALLPAAPRLATSRLVLQPLAIADAAAIQRLFPRWEIVRHLNDRVPWPYPPDGALGYVRDVALPAAARGEEWHWTLRLREAPDDVIGAISLMLEEDNNRGFWLGLPWQGRGLMAEAAEAVTGFWFETLGRPVLRVPKAVANRASSRLSERMGMRLVGIEMRDYVAGRLETELWEITREDWRARQAGTGSPASRRPSNCSTSSTGTGRLNRKPW
ncbi:GNAT family N-acetyltransferase [Azospirillum picis]|uniref:RimJ/RimL family protein N-acetyltransferase n=1 Tax=Azospirillum picis TaxID=488438 RepID=A0ABU0MPI2_9PROT|nr:GNAT family N-acetyltransferase [Azospirillum picis]MBP2301323.1 RimJ/RimL family protein N-acetyltransferase [Azospirillum picis]MDQ0535154.1 RimJ/RimL family protein N-acetyltransferase [Azospirillum picis]